MSKFWKMKKVKNAAELILYGDISSESWWGDEITPKQMADELKALGNVDEIVVRINSGGGDVFAGVAIHSMLKRHDAKVTVYVDGLAASIASVIAMAGDKIIMPKGSMIMVHNPWSWTVGESKDFRKMADTLDTIRDSMLEIYTTKTGMSSDEVKALLDAETWLTATEAVEKGFATEIEESQNIAASINGKASLINGIKMDLSKYSNAPKVAPAVPEGPEEVDDDEDGAPMFDVGDNVQITIPARVEGHVTGTVRQAMLTYVYGIQFEGMEDQGIYHWYSEDELIETPDTDEMDDPVQATPAPAASSRNIDLEMRLLELSQYNKN